MSVAEVAVQGTADNPAGEVMMIAAAVHSLVLARGALKMPTIMASIGGSDGDDQDPILAKILRQSQESDEDESGEDDTADVREALDKLVIGLCAAVLQRYTQPGE